MEISPSQNLYINNKVFSIYNFEFEINTWIQADDDLIDSHKYIAHQFHCAHAFKNYDSNYNEQSYLDIGIVKVILGFRTKNDYLYNSNKAVRLDRLYSHFVNADDYLKKEFTQKYFKNVFENGFGIPHPYLNFYTQKNANAQWKVYKKNNPFAVKKSFLNGYLLGLSLSNIEIFDNDKTQILIRKTR